MNEIISVSEVVKLNTGNKDSIDLNYTILINNKENQHIFLNEINTHKSLYIYNSKNCAIYINDSNLKCFETIIICRCDFIQLYVQKNINILQISISNNIKVHLYNKTNSIKINACSNISLHTFSNIIHGIPIFIAGGFDLILNIIDSTYHTLFCNMFFEGFLSMYDKTNNKVHYRRVRLTNTH